MKPPLTREGAYPRVNTALPMEMPCWKGHTAPGACRRERRKCVGAREHREPRNQYRYELQNTAEK